MVGKVATEDYIQSMDQEEGVFGSERFRSPEMSTMTDNAKDVVLQIMKQYNSGDADTVQAVQNWEFQKYKEGFTDNEQGHRMARQYMSGNKLSQESAWELFYQAHQKYIGTALGDESKEMPAATRAKLEESHGFDMEGRKVFPFESLVSKGKLSPKDVKVAADPVNPSQGVDFDKLFRSGR